MARYIDADALIKRLGINQDCTECSYCTRKYYCSWNPDPGEICIAISEMPTVTINDHPNEIKVTNCNYNHIAEVSKKGDMISRQQAIDAIFEAFSTGDEGADRYIAEKILANVPSAQPEIIRCKECKHWHQNVGDMEGFGLGDCDYLGKKLVTCNGYCYWAERRADETD